MIIKEGGWYKLRNNTVVGPLVRINDTVFDFWCPSAGFKVWKAGGRSDDSGWLESDYDAVEQIPEHRIGDISRVYGAVLCEFSSYFIASIVCGMVHLNCEKVLESRHILIHLIKAGNYTAELCAEFDHLFYTVRSRWPDAYQQALDCWAVHYEWQCRQALHGLGGCERKTFKELLEKLNHKVNK